MKLAFLLPPFTSCLYDLGCMLNADVILFDDVSAYSRKSRVHRGEIRTPDGTQWLNIPVKTEDKKKPLHEVRINHGENWIELHKKALAYNYRNSIYFEYYEPEIYADLDFGKECEFLLEFTGYFFQRLITFLQLDLPETKFLSEFGTSISDADEAIKITGAELIWHEQNSRNYQKQAEKFALLEIELPEYRQHFPGFEPDCCLLDVLFQYGPESFKITDRLLLKG